MSATVSPNTVSELFQQATEQFETGIKAGIKIQEESLRMLLSTMKSPYAPHEWTQQVQATIERIIPTTQKRIEEACTLMNENVKKSLDMLQDVWDSAQNGPMQAQQAKARELGENMLGALRANMQAIVQVNSRALQMWEELTSACCKAPAETKV